MKTSIFGLNYFYSNGIIAFKINGAVIQNLSQPRDVDSLTHVVAAMRGARPCTHTDDTASGPVGGSTSESVRGLPVRCRASPEAILKCP